MARVEGHPEYDYAYELNLAGATVGDRQQLVERLKHGEELELMREPDNSHDKNAVAVYARGDQVGYIPEWKARMVADFMDQGKVAEAWVEGLELYERERGGEAIGLVMLLGLGGQGRALVAEKVELADESKPSFAERMVAAGDSVQKAGDTTSKAGCSITGFVFALFLLAVIGFVIWAIAC